MKRSAISRSGSGGKTSCTLDLDGVPVHLTPDTTLRVKVIDTCGLACTFCHNEGTPVAADNQRRTASTFIPFGSSGRSSIYAGSNGAKFISAQMDADAGFARSLETMVSRFATDEVHLTGGEPTLHPRISSLVQMASDMGLRVAMTSNGENGERVLEQCAKAGLDRINLSIFGTTPYELAEVQSSKYSSVSLAQRKISAMDATIRAAVANDVRVNANIVVPDRSHIGRVHRLLDTYSTSISVRLLNSLHDGRASIDAIYEILDSLGSRPVAHYVTAGASGYKTRYTTDSGTNLFFKKIRPAHLSRDCASCVLRSSGSCEEGYYGMRLYKSTDGEYIVGVCIQRMDLSLPLDKFISSDLASQVLLLREEDMSNPDAVIESISEGLR